LSSLDPQGVVAHSAAAPPNPDWILQLGLGFMSTKVLLSAVELGVFTKLAQNPMDGEALALHLGLHPRSARDFLDSLVALGLLDRTGQIYRNTPEADFFLDRAKPSYIGGLFEMINARLYGFWGSLTEALQTGKPQSEAKTGIGDAFADIYRDPNRLRGFLQAMTGLSISSGRVMAENFPWHRYKTVGDVGGAQGGVAVQIALAHPHLSGFVFDLPPVKLLCEEYVASFGLADRLRFVTGDFFKEPLPQADVIIMGHVLHDWNLDEKRLLISKVYEALPAGGAFLALDAMIDDERRRNVPGLLISLNMLIETTGGFDYTGADICAWMRDAGFRETRVERLTGPDSMAVAIK
jgi:O-methyltransferase/methyltransferase family protein